MRRRRGTGEVDSLVPTGSGNAVEAICEYLRKEVAQPLCTVHRPVHQVRLDRLFFVLTVNLLGLLPISGFRPSGAHVGGTATANPWITGALALMTLVLMIFNGVRLGGRPSSATSTPAPVAVVAAVPIEVIGLVRPDLRPDRPYVANMVAGHVLLAVLLSFIFSAAANSIASGLGVAVPVVLGSIAIMMLEISWRFYRLSFLRS